MRWMAGLAFCLALSSCTGRDGSPADVAEEDETLEIEDEDIEADTPAGPYGTVDVSFSSAFIFDFTRRTETGYIQSHSDDGVQVTPTAFSGSYGSSATIPGADAIMTQSMAFHVPEDTYPPFVAVIQQSFSDMIGTITAPTVELDFTSDSFSTGIMAIDVVVGAGALLTVFDIPAPGTSCVAAVGMYGAIDVTTAVDTTSTEGGSVAFEGADIPLYHPTDTPRGDISAELEAAGLEICPIE